MPHRCMRLMDLKDRTCPISVCNSQIIGPEGLHLLGESFGGIRGRIFAFTQLMALVVRHCARSDLFFLHFQVRGLVEAFVVQHVKTSAWARLYILREIHWVAYTHSYGSEIPFSSQTPTTWERHVCRF